MEPDALAQLCRDAADSYRLLHSAVDVLKANLETPTYLDAGHSNWNGAQTVAERLRSTGVADADSFALNLSNFQRRRTT